ncbi:CRISPR-associated protein Csx19 [Streptomyces sp. NPDC051041]|uniref:type III-D CRISPR-associated protein Csx19 n=1 Tax=Streptomyces sp. NPDC051041 TaxID=3365640 RepID=UPI0037AD701E
MAFLHRRGEPGITTVLHSRAADGITLHDALAAIGFTEAVALLSSPHEHAVVQVRADRCRTARGADYALDAVFEARAFDQDRELRWLCQAGPIGRAVLLTEDPGKLPPADIFTEPVADLEATTTWPAHYLLWGRPLRGTATWTTLHTPQIGTLDVPFPYTAATAERPGTKTTEHQRLRLAAREYVCVEPVHGNAYVSEERLLRIEPAPTEPAAGRK